MCKKNCGKCKVEITVDPVVEQVRQDLLSRSQVGIKKYGVTLARTDVDLEGWLQHLLEEQMDAVLYTKAAILKIQEEKNKEFNSEERIG